MNATTHPVPHTHHATHGWAITGIAGAIAAAAVATVLTMAVSNQDDVTNIDPGTTSAMHGSTRDRAGVHGPCFMRPARWNDDVAGSVPTC